MKETKKHENDLELCSERVRNIVGQVPSSFVCYGISSIGTAMVFLMVVTSFLPYKQLYSGSAVVYDNQSLRTDSAIVPIRLCFEGTRPTNNALSQIIILGNEEGIIKGRVLHLSASRDTLGFQRAKCIFKKSEIEIVKNQTIDFKVIESSGSLLKKILRL